MKNGEILRGRALPPVVAPLVVSRPPMPGSAQKLRQQRSDRLA